MRLVIEYGDSDGCTYSCDVTVPVVYASAEAFAVDFEKFCKDLYSKGFPGGYINGGNIFAGTEWYADFFFEDGVYHAPKISTVDEWFGAVE